MSAIRLFRSRPTARYARHTTDRRRRRLPGLVAAAAVATGLVAGVLPPSTAQAAPPTPPSASQALTMLNSLTVAAEGSMDGYDRSLFPHWLDQGDNCNTREVVLKRDGTNVVTNNACEPTSGSWTSPYDGVTTTDPSSLDIDHVVPLAEAWKSGANTWSQAKRTSFANNLEASQLVAVSASSNRSKGDKDPAEWMPPKTSYHCTYARMWVWVKYNYSATVDSAEKSKLTSVLNGC